MAISLVLQEGRGQVPFEGIYSMTFFNPSCPSAAIFLTGESCARRTPGSCSLPGTALEVREDSNHLLNRSLPPLRPTFLVDAVSKPYS